MNAQPEESTLVAELRTLLADVVDVDEELMGYETHFINDLGVDSLMALEVMVTLERKYQVKLSEGDLQKMTCLREVHELLVDRLEAASSVAADPQA